MGGVGGIPSALSADALQASLSSQVQDASHHASYDDTYMNITPCDDMPSDSDIDTDSKFIILVSLFVIVLFVALLTVMWLSG